MQGRQAPKMRVENEAVGKILDLDPPLITRLDDVLSLAIVENVSKFSSFIKHQSSCLALKPRVKASCQRE